METEDSFGEYFCRKIRNSIAVSSRDAYYMGSILVVERVSCRHFNGEECSLGGVCVPYRQALKNSKRRNKSVLRASPEIIKNLENIRYINRRCERESRLRPEPKSAQPKQRGMHPFDLMDYMGCSIGKMQI